MIILGIETSCDETALALIEVDGDRYRVIQSLVHSQAELHSAYGGVYPSLAKREHGKNIVPLLSKLLTESAGALIDLNNPAIPEESFKAILETFRTGLQESNPDLWESLSHADFLRKIPKIDRIAVTEGPGLEPALWVGITFARIIGDLWKVPIIPVNHMEGHIVGSLLETDAPYGSWQKLKELPLPAIAILISGGHTEIIHIKDRQHSDITKSDKFTPHLEYKIIGQTKDDAVGEAFDKVARLIGLPYPGGPHISRLSEEAEKEGVIPAVTLPRPMIKSGNLDFSFSGLKTAVLYAVRDCKNNDDTFKKGLALEFERAVSDTLDAKIRLAIEETNANAVIIGGGVSANKRLRERFEKTAKEFGIPIFLPSRHISGDNALMIALAASLHSDDVSNNIRAQGTKRLG